ncbi:MAG: sulfite exporter TauE/SafE family protein [Acidimicrobiales bacterium]
MSAGVVVALAGVFLVAALVQGISGFGFALLSMPLLSLIVDPKQAVAVSTLIGTVASGSVLVRHRHFVRWDLARPLLVSAAAGMPLGLYLLVVIAERPLRLLLAVVVVAFAGLLAFGWRLQGTNRAFVALAGFISGLLNTSLSTNGPPLVVVLQARDLEPDEFRGTISALFFASGLGANVLLAGAGRYHQETLVQAAIGVPALLIGSAVGARLAQRVPPAGFRRIVLGLLVVTALASAIAAITS